MNRAASIAVPVPDQERDAGAPDIAALTARLTRGDEVAYREFHALYFNRLLRYVFVATGGDEQGARDALQGTFLRAVRHMRRFESEASFWSWLTVLAKSAVVDQSRKESRYRRLLRRFLHPEPPPDPIPLQEPGPVLAEHLDAALLALAPDERDLIERKYFAKQTVREIAAALGSTEKAIESRLVRLRRILQSSIIKRLHETES